MQRRLNESTEKYQGLKNCYEITDYVEISKHSPNHCLAEKGGLYFKKDNATKKHVHNKCNKHLDMDMAIRITAGSTWSCCQQQNFAKNALMTFRDKDAKPHECRFNDTWNRDANRAEILFEGVPADEGVMEVMLEEAKRKAEECASGADASWSSPFASPRASNEIQIQSMVNPVLASPASQKSAGAIC